MKLACLWTKWLIRPLSDLNFFAHFQQLHSVLQTIENDLIAQLIRLLRETYQHLAIDNSILSLISNGIKCQNYVTLNIHLIRMRSNLQEHIIDIEDKETKPWNDMFMLNYMNNKIDFQSFGIKIFGCLKKKIGKRYRIDRNRFLLSRILSFNKHAISKI